MEDIGQGFMDDVQTPEGVAAKAGEVTGTALVMWTSAGAGKKLKAKKAEVKKYGKGRPTEGQGYSKKGYNPKPGERSMSKTEWKNVQRQARADVNGSAFGKVDSGDVARYNRYWDDVSKGLDPDTRVKLNQWKYRPRAELYNKYKRVYDNPKYYNQETGNVNWPENDGFVNKQNSVVKKRTSIGSVWGTGRSIHVTERGTV